MLIYYLLLHVLVGWFGSGEAVVRLPSVVATAATGGLTAALAWRLSGSRSVALSSGVLAVVSLPLVFWGQDARGYALMVTLAVGSQLAYVVIVQSRGRTPRTAVAAYVLVTLLSLYVSYYAGLVVLAQLAVLPLFRDRARLIVGCLVVVALACIPLAVLAVQRGSGQLFWVDYPTPGIVAQAAVAMISAGLPPSFHATGATVVAVAATLALTVALAAWLLATTGGGGRLLAARRRNDSLWIAASWLVVPTAVMLVLAFAGEPIELQRSIILVIPVVGVLLAWGLHHERVAPAVGWAGVVLLVAVRVATIAPTYKLTPENWKATVAYVAAASRDRDCVLFYPQDGRMPFDYYLRGSPVTARLTPVLPTLPWSLVRPYVEQYTVPSSARVSEIVRSCPRLWVIASHEGHRPGPPASERDLTRYRGLLAELRRRYRHSAERQFGYAAVIYVTRLWR